MGLTTLKRRSEFLRVRGGLRWSTPALVLEAKPRAAGLDAGPDESGQLAGSARFGFTVTKKIGNAVVRNRVRRRFKEAVRELLPQARDGFDYVVIARPPAIEQSYADLKADLLLALSRMHRVKDRSKHERCA